LIVCDKFAILYLSQGAGIMKKIIVGFLCIFVLISCEIPQSITVKGHPGVYLPIGSPFPDRNGLGDQISHDNIQEMMGGSENIYDYQRADKSDGVDPNVQAYVVRYPLINKWKIIDDSNFDISDYPDYTLDLIPSDGELSYLFTGKFEINNSLSSFLGDDVRYSNVKAYIYMTGIDGATLSLTIGDFNTIGELSQQSFPSSSANRWFTGKLSPHSFGEPINLTDAFYSTADENGLIIIKYEINIPLNLQTIGKTISADLVLLLPLEFKIYTPSGYLDYSNYAKLSLGDIFPEFGSGDLFGRTGDNDLLQNIDMIKITLKNLENDIMDNNKLGILIAADSYRNLIDFSMDSPSLEIDIDDLPNPFNPRFEILIKKDTPSAAYAPLGIKRQDPNKTPKFDFFLTVEARADIDYTIKF
jgi:hypothetical protein